MIEKRGSKYRVKFHLGKGRRLSKTFSTFNEAFEWKKRMNAKKILGQLELNNNSIAKLVIYNDLVKDWYATDILKLSPSTKTQYRATIRKYFFPTLRTKDITKITSEDCDLIFQKLNESKLSVSSINKALILLRQVFSFAVKRDLLDKNPARNLRNLKSQSPEMSFLSEVEINRLLNLVRGEWFYGAILIALNTGMRLGEIAGLQWDMVDFDNKIIHVSRNLTKSGLNEFTKTKVRKAIPMNEAVYEFLSKHKRSKLVSKYVIIDLKGNPIRPDHFTNRRQCMKAGIA